MESININNGLLKGKWIRLALRKNIFVSKNLLKYTNTVTEIVIVKTYTVYVKTVFYLV